MLLGNTFKPISLNIQKREKAMIKSEKRQVFVVGGTHGNEFTGVYLIKKLRSEGQKTNYKKINPFFELGNEEAFKQNRRYVDHDLNRCFSKDFLLAAKKKLKEKGEGSLEHEEKLALGFDKKFEEGRADFIIDLHTTTSHMGPTIILSHKDKLSLSVATHLKNVFPTLKIICEFKELEDNYCLFTQANSGILLEFGPVPQGVLKSELFLLMESVVQETLLFLDREGEVGSDSSKIEELETFHVLENLDFPRDENGELKGMIHPDREGKDFIPIRDGGPLFICFDGEIIHWKGPTVWPIFMNEAAYYEKSVAMVLTSKQKGF